MDRTGRRADRCTSPRRHRLEDEHRGPHRVTRWDGVAAEAEVTLALARGHDDLEDRGTDELLEIIAVRLLADDQLQLAQLQTGSDEYNLVLVTKRQAPRLVALGKAARFGGVELFTGAKLARLEKRRKREDEANRQAASADPDRQRSFVHPDGRVWLTYGNTWWPTDRPEQHFMMVTAEGTLGRRLRSDAERITRDRQEIRRWRAEAFAARRAEGLSSSRSPSMRSRTRHGSGRSADRAPDDPRSRTGV